MTRLTLSHFSCVTRRAEMYRPTGQMIFLSQIHFEGDESFQKNLHTLCSEFADIFSDKLAPQAANLKPFEINLPRQKWEVPSNRTPVRPQSSKKEHYLRTSIEEMLEDGVIERSNAAYYSHPVMVNKTADVVGRDGERGRGVVGLVTGRLG